MRWIHNSPYGYGMGLISISEEGKAMTQTNKNVIPDKENRLAYVWTLTNRQ